VRKIVGEAMTVLEKAGMLVYAPSARQALAAAGAAVDNETLLVRLPRRLVEDAVASNPSSVTLCSRDGSADVALEGNRVYYATGGTAIYVLDPDSQERRPSTLQDVALNARFVEALDNIHAFTINVFPNDIEEKDHIDVNRFFHSLANTRKHVMGGLYSQEGCRRTVAMAEMIAGGADALRARPFVSFITLVISPLKIDKNYGEMTCYLAEKGLPVVIPAEPICGTTAPITLAGNVLMHVAETLGGIALVQSVRRGAPGICGSVGSITNLRTMDHVAGAIERAMINAAVAQVIQHLELPLYSTAGTTDSKTVDVQAAYESAMASLLVAMSGANYIHDIAGLMEADLTVSYEKLVVDNEILGMCQRVLRGVEVNDETLATDLIVAKGPGAHFVGEEHTVEHMRGEFFMPALADRKKRGGRAPAGGALDRARAFVDELRRTPPDRLLEPGLRDRILAAFPEIQGDLP
jgi:trimethylamine--corrinoid protein Co-methyltransferase